jgi:UDP-N-acetylglucosamine 2-epimerase (non-hydrolysing)
MPLKKQADIHLIGAARPNFMKIAPLFHALRQNNLFNALIVHTGQHYDQNMSGDFFKELGLPKPRINLNVGSGSHARQTGRTLMAYEEVLLKNRPELVVVVGDVNATLACALAAAKLGVPVAHLEAGLRSYDRTMPEEINRLVTDTLADRLWTPSEDADKNLLKEGIDPARIKLVGNIMIDSLEMMRERIQADQTVRRLGVDPREYGVLTLHRPATVDSRQKLSQAVQIFLQVAEKLKMVFPVHPRTYKKLKEFELLEALKRASGLKLLKPLSYIPFMNILFNSRLAITDSGGLQEETTYLGIPCLTMRPNTERPITRTPGSNRLCRVEELPELVEAILKKSLGKYAPPRFWDGRTAQRVVSDIEVMLLN